MKRRGLRIIQIMTAAAIPAALAVTTGTALADGSDNFDSYANGTDLLTSGGNGQITYFNSAPGAGPVLPTSAVEAVDVGDSQSAPNVMRYADNGVTSSSYRVRLEPDSIIDLSGIGTRAEIAFDFKTQSGCCGGRVSMSWKPLYSTDTGYSSEDNIDNNHGAGLGDNGSWFLQGGAVTNAAAYLPDNWYRARLTVERVSKFEFTPPDPQVDFDYTLELIDIDGGNNSLGVLNAGSFRDAGRTWLTGLGLYSSSNPSEITLFDNFSFTTVSAPLPGPGAVRSAANLDGLGAGAEIRGTSNGDITWSDSTPLSGSPLGFNPPDGLAGHVITNTADVQSGPNSMEFLSRADATGGAFTGRLNPAQVIEVDGDTSARFSVDFKTVGARNSTAIKLLWSTDENGASEDNIGNNHTIGISDAGGWFVEGGLTPGPILYSADTWYNMDLVIEAPNAGEHDLTLKLTDIATGDPLGTARITGLGDAGRRFLTGLSIFGSSNPSETILFDDFSFDCIGDCATGPVLLFGDADNSGTVTADDLIAVQQNFGNVGPNGDGTDVGDANDDGVVTADDLIAVQQNFGATLGPAGSAVPEPATLGLVGLGGLMAARRARPLRFDASRSFLRP